ncbi:hypothetical protein CRD60_04780 [Bifidobacterium aemilianum]|uniref:NodB homology domain-containing protein n=1 Tax=Bifidobacterium aemilianum TaxID=2493120 RepID=A0A366K8A1_9BIFI|nr:polysaccharide deacetylase family protein [Bifidobacterium aemilianum]RBP97899.1 hypothetical protein CRD60_04780 [Bifidobacterium aemilianum]
MDDATAYRSDSKRGAPHGDSGDRSGRRKYRRGHSGKVLVSLLVMASFVLLAGAVAYRPVYRYYRQAIADCMEWGNSLQINKQHLSSLVNRNAGLLDQAKRMGSGGANLGPQEIERAADSLKKVEAFQAAQDQSGSIPSCQAKQLIWDLRTNASSSKDKALAFGQRIASLQSAFDPLDRVVLDRDAEATSASRQSLEALVPGMASLIKDSQGQVDKASVRDDLSDGVRQVRRLLDQQPAVPRHELEDARQRLYRSADRVIQAQNRKAGIDCGRQHCLALTFDDGPSPMADEVLKTLKVKGVTASFFAIGQRVNATTGAKLKIAADRGYPVGSHTWSHENLPDILSQHHETQQLDETSSVIASATGRPVNLVRPPHGVVDEASRAYIGNHLAAGIALYNAEGYDWAKGASVSSVKQKVLSQARPGDIILMHDTFTHTVKALPDIIDGLRKQGQDYRLVTIEQLTGEYPRPGAVYYSRTNILRM